MGDLADGDLVLFGRKKTVAQFLHDESVAGRPWPASGLQILLLVKVLIDSLLPFSGVTEVVSFPTNLFVEMPAWRVIAEREIVERFGPAVAAR